MMHCHRIVETLSWIVFFY